MSIKLLFGGLEQKNFFFLMASLKLRTPSTPTAILSLESALLSWKLRGVRIKRISQQPMLENVNGSVQHAQLVAFYLIMRFRTDIVSWNSSRTDEVRTPRTLSHVLTMPIPNF